MVLALSSIGKFCVPFVNVEGNVQFGENIYCYNVGNVKDGKDNMFNNFRNIKCNSCGLDKNLKGEYLEVFNGTRKNREG